MVLPVQKRSFHAARLSHPDLVELRLDRKHEKQCLCSVVCDPEEEKKNIPYFYNFVSHGREVSEAMKTRSDFTSSSKTNWMPDLCAAPFLPLK